VTKTVHIINIVFYQHIPTSTRSIDKTSKWSLLD